MVNVRESRRSVIDAPSLEEWLTRMARAEPPIAGTRWLDLEKLIKNDFTLSAQLWRVFVSTDGVKGVAIFGATTGDGRQGRIIRALIPDAREVDGPVGAKVQKLFIELMMAEQKAPPVPERKP